MLQLSFLISLAVAILAVIALKSKQTMAITVYYWGPTQANMYGRAIGIYATLYEAGIDDFAMKAPKDMPPGSSFAPPCVDIDGTLVGQTPAALFVLGEKFGLIGNGGEEKARVMQTLLDFNDIFQEHGKFVENKERKAKWFDYLEKKLESTADNCPWAAGTSQPTVADFHGAFAFEWVVKKGIDFSEYPNITKWWNSIRNWPSVKKLYDSCVDGRTMIP